MFYNAHKFSLTFNFHLKVLALSSHTPQQSKFQMFVSLLFFSSENLAYTLVPKQMFPYVFFKAVAGLLLVIIGTVVCMLTDIDLKSVVLFSWSASGGIRWVKSRFVVFVFLTYLS